MSRRCSISCRVAAERLPLLGFTHVAGRVREGLPCAGVPVVVGAMDAWGGMFGVGVARMATRCTRAAPAKSPASSRPTVNPTPGVILFPPYEGIVMHAAPTQTGGAALAWLGNMLGRSPAEMSGLAESIEPSSAIPVFLPHLQRRAGPDLGQLFAGRVRAARQPGRGGGDGARL